MIAECLESQCFVTPQFHGKSNREFRELQHMSKAKLIGDINATKQDRVESDVEYETGVETHSFVE